MTLNGEGGNPRNSLDRKSGHDQEARTDYRHKLITYNPSRGWYETDSPIH